MRLLIVGGLQGQIGMATKIAMDRGAKVTHAGSIDQALSTLRGGVGADLVFCGRFSVDAETAQVGPELAELLGWPQATAARSVCLSSDRARALVVRETDDGTETLDIPLPFVITAAEDIAPERFPARKDRDAAKAKPVVTLTAADLAPGTLPGPDSGKVPIMASRAATPTAPNGSTVLSPSGPYGPADESFVGIAPVAMEVSDLHAVTDLQGIGQAVQVAIESGPVLGDGTAVLACTIASQTSTCSSTGKATIPAGSIFFIRVTNGPGGGSGSFIAVSYTVRVP